MAPTSTSGRLVLLAGLAYLGFYVYGLVMGVFSPGEMAGFTAVAAGILIGCGLYAIYLKRATVDPEEERKALHTLHEQQRRRGF